MAACDLLEKMKESQLWGHWFREGNWGWWWERLGPKGRDWGSWSDN